MSESQLQAQPATGASCTKIWLLPFWILWQILGLFSKGIRGLLRILAQLFQTLVSTVIEQAQNAIREFVGRLFG